MLKNILKVSGAQSLSKNELKTINGGGTACDPKVTCPFAPACPTGTYEFCCECIPCPNDEPEC